VSERVLILIENQPYPGDRRVHMEAVALQQAGYEVTVVAPTGVRSPNCETVLDGVRVIPFPAPPAGGGALGYAREYGVAMARIAAVLRRLRREPPFSAVIACNPPDTLLHLARPFRRRGAGLIFDYHDPAPELFEAMFDRRGPLHRVLLGLERAAFRTADVVMTVNDSCADLVRERGGVADKRVHVVRNCPDPGRFFPSAPVPSLRCGREHLVLWLGHIARKEGLDLLIEAADELVNRRGRSDVAFAIVGPGTVRDELAEAAHARGLRDVVHLPGEADDGRLREYIATADVCVSVDPRNELNDRSLMIKVLEYMIMGKAVVQFPLLEMQRTCGDATAYARDADPIDLADQIAGLLDDGERRAALEQRAAERARGSLTWSHEVPTLLRAVDQGIAVGAARGRHEVGAAIAAGGLP
jgi:glycosyltransferase involved in cell wall biosynthesis